MNIGDLLHSATHSLNILIYFRRMLASSTSYKTETYLDKSQNWEGRVSKQLERFLIDEDLVGQNYRFQQWVDTRGFSNNFPIYLEILGNSSKPPSPFKLCATWIKEEVSNIIKNS